MFQNIETTHEILLILGVSLEILLLSKARGATLLILNPGDDIFSNIVN